MNSICALSQGTGEEMTVTCCLGNADGRPGILGMCSDDQGLLLLPLPLLPILGMVLWTPRHNSQAPKSNRSLLFSPSRCFFNNNQALYVYAHVTGSMRGI